MADDVYKTGAIVHLPARVVFMFDMPTKLYISLGIPSNMQVNKETF